MKKILLALALIFGMSQTSSASFPGLIQNSNVASQAQIQASVLTTTGNLSSGGACIASPASIAGLVSGLYIYDSTTPTNVPSGTTIVGIATSPCTSGQIKMSANAAGTATGDTLTFGGTAAQLINDTKIWLTANSLNTTLSAAITAGAIGGGGGGGVQLLANSGFEIGSSGNPPPSWTITTGTGSLSTAVFYAGTQAAVVTASSQTSSIQQDVTPTQVYNAVNMEASCKVLTTLTNVQVCPRLVGSDITAQCVAVPSTGTWQYVAASFVGASSGSMGVQVGMTGSGTGSFTVDDCYVGPSRLLGTGFFGVDPVAYTPTLTGFGTASSVSVQYSKAGKYLIAQGSFVAGTVTASLASLTLPAGLTIDTGVITIANTSSNPGQVVGVYGNNGSGSTTANIVTATGTSTSILYFAQNGGSAANITPANGNNISATGNTTSFSFKIPIQGWSSGQSAYRADVTPASWSGYMSNSGAGSTTSSTYVDITNTTSQTLTQVSNRNFGTVTLAASQVGIVVPFPRSGNYNICAYGNIGSSTTGLQASARLVDGTGTIINSGMFNQTQNGASMVSLCGIYSASAGSATIKIQAAASGGTTFVGQVQGATGTGSFSWSILELDAPMPAPYLVGSITSNTSGQEHVERAKITNSGSCAIASQSGSWLSSVSHPATGKCALVFTGSEFSGAPQCTCSGVGNTNTLCEVFVAETTSGVTIDTTNSGTFGDNIFNIICMGPR